MTWLAVGQPSRPTRASQFSGSKPGPHGDQKVAACNLAVAPCLACRTLRFANVIEGISPSDGMHVEVLVPTVLQSFDTRLFAVLVPP
jgi:hypothetical protein